MENGTCSNESQGSGSTGAGSSGASRWNPTKEQIEILEGMYKAGIRTPTAEQIQHITGRLRAYGHIEGKNVFYWFQNHKARQRQKEKQESLSFLSRYFHQRTRNATAAAAGFPSPCPNVICGPCYVPHGDLGFYPIHPKILRPCAVKKRQWSEFNSQESFDPYYGLKVHNHPRLQSQLYESGKSEKCNAMPDDFDRVHGVMPRRTLDLFPLHPTGIVNGNNPRVNIDAPACAGSSEVVDY